MLPYNIYYYVKWINSSLFLKFQHTHESLKIILLGKIITTDTGLAVCIEFEENLIRKIHYGSRIIILHRPEDIIDYISYWELEANFKFYLYFYLNFILTLKR